jgi:hypothetical protein
MVDNRAPRGLVVSALAAAVLAVSMFLPWYSVSITPSGAAAAQQEFAAVAQEYGNADLQTMADQIGARFGSVAGRPLTTVSAHQALKDISKIVLLLAGIALLGLSARARRRRRDRWSPDRARRLRGAPLRALPDSLTAWRGHGPRLTVARLGQLARARSRRRDRRRGALGALHRPERTSRARPPGRPGPLAPPNEERTRACVAK